MVTRPSPERGRRSQRAPDQDELREEQLKFARGVRPELGHTCLVRAIVPGNHDVLAAFTTAAMDDAGTWIVWRVLRQRSLREESKPK